MHREYVPVASWLDGVVAIGDQAAATPKGRSCVRCVVAHPVNRRLSKGTRPFCVVNASSSFASLIETGRCVRQAKSAVPGSPTGESRRRRVSHPVAGTAGIWNRGYGTLRLLWLWRGGRTLPVSSRSPPGRPGRCSLSIIGRSRTARSYGSLCVEVESGHSPFAFAGEGQFERRGRPRISCAAHPTLPWRGQSSGAEDRGVGEGRATESSRIRGAGWRG